MNVSDFASIFFLAVPLTVLCFVCLKFIKHTSIGLYCSSLVFFKPTALESFQIFHDANSFNFRFADIFIDSLSLSLVITLVAFIALKVYKPSLISVLLVALTAYNVLITVLYKGELIGVFRAYGIGTCLSLFIDLCSHYSVLHKLFKAFSRVLVFMVCVTFVELLMYYTDGMNIYQYREHMLLSGPKVYVYYLMSTLMFLIAYRYITNKKVMSLSLYLLLGMSFVGLTNVSSAGGLVALSVFCILLALNSNETIKNLLPSGFLLSISILFFALFVFLRIQGYFSFFIETILDRDVTFTSRTYLWDLTIQEFKLHPIFGSGYKKYIIPNGTTYNDSHSAYLEFLQQGGVIGTSCVVSMLFIYLKNMRQNKENDLYWFINAWSFPIFLLLAFEPLSKIVFYIPLILSQHISNILLEKKDIPIASEASYKAKIMPQSRYILR